MVVGRRVLGQKREELNASLTHLRLMSLSLVVIGLLCAVFCEQLMVQVIHLPEFGFFFPSAYLAATMVVPEGVLMVAILVFVVVTWAPSRAPRRPQSQPLLAENSRDDAAVPLKYADY